MWKAGIVMRDDPYEEAVMGQAIRDLSRKLHDTLKAEDASIAFDAIGMTIIWILMEGELSPGISKQEFIDGWTSQLRRGVARTC
jgi:hypothetical protein